jgi:Tol biopolymer transport system component
MTKQLATIKSLPTSKIEVLDQTYDSSFGVAFSPDHQKVAYSTSNEHHWQTLKIRDWKEGSKPETIEDKFLGSSIAFTPDSNRLVYSSLHRSKNYYTWSDLRVHDLVTEKSYWLTENERARDPDLSRDGEWIAYTVASDSGTDLMIGKLGYRDGELQIVSKKKIFDAAPFNRVSNPRFSIDLKGIVFAYKVDGKTSEEILYIPRQGGTATSIVSDGSRNRFPAFDPRGNLFFVSDRSGVDNVYRHDAGRDVLVTNVTGGIWLPTFRGPELFASVLSKDGFSIAKVETFLQGLDQTKVKIKHAQAGRPPRRL